MVRFLRKLFIKDYENIADEQVRHAHGKLASFVGVFSNLFLFVVKLVIGVLCGSVSMIADSINNLSDMGSSIVTLVGFRLAQAPADSHHPYGHQRIEYISGLIVSVVIVFVGGNLLVTSIDKVVYYEKETISSYLIFISMAILAVAILIKFWQSYFNRKIGRLIHSVALLATAKDSLNDCISTFVVLVGNIVILCVPDLSFSIDGVMGIFVSLFILFSGIRLIKDTTDPLIGVPMDEAFVQNILREIEENEFVLGCHDPVCHFYGPTKCFMTVHVEVDGDQKLIEIHEVIDELERKLSQKYHLNMTIHMDPVQVGDPEVEEVKQWVQRKLADLHLDLSFHDFRIVKKEEIHQVFLDILLPYDCEKTPEDINRYLENEAHQANLKIHLNIEYDHAFMQSPNEKEPKKTEKP